MKPYVFSIGILLMLSFSLAGLESTVARLLRRFEMQFGPLLSLAIASTALVSLIAALAWSVPPRG